MADMVFGNFPVDMTNPTFLVNALNGRPSLGPVSSAQITLFLSNGTDIIITGSFNFSSEAAFVNNSTMSGFIVNDGGNNLVFSLTGLPAIPFSRFLALSGSEIDALARGLPVTTHGSNFNDHLVGGVADDTLYGNSGNDILADNVGNDTLVGGSGNDTMAGGLGNDTYVIDGPQDLITELPGQGTDMVVAPFDDYVLGANLENIGLSGAAIRGTGNAGSNLIVGTSLDNILDGAAGSDTLMGGPGNDTYYVDSGSDVIIEAAGGGGDTVLSSAASFAMGANAETLILLPGAASGTGNAQDNILQGNGNNNVLSGGAGNDLLQGGRGYDAMSGGAGNDTYYVNSGDGAGTAKLAPVEDQVLEALNAGTDTVHSSVYAYTLEANVENLVLEGIGRKGFGNGLNNALTGNGLANTLEGGAGNDTLSGGTGADRLTGGAGNDSFVFDNLGAGVDRITDFTGAGVPGGDVIQLSFAVFGGIGTAGLAMDASAFVANAGGTALDADDRIVYNATTGALYYDADGNGGDAAVQFALLGGAPALSAADIGVIA